MRVNSNVLQTDSVVIGTGILGLLLAKRLLDFGQSVVLIDRSPTIANGASSMNHGWVHRGSAPILTCEDETRIPEMVEKLKYGHDFFKSYAPECFDEPFEPTYAVTNDPAKAARARELWPKAGIDYKELTRDEFYAVEPNINPELAKYYFEVPESRINNTLLFMKLLNEIRKNGALIFMASEYEHEGLYDIRITSGESERRVHSPVFFYATGTNLDESYQKFTGESLNMRYCKSHLLYLPKVTNASIIGLDAGAPIIINHADMSVINRSYDETRTLSNTDFAVDDEEVRKSLRALGEYYPLSRRAVLENINARAFLKPYIATTPLTGRHSADQVVLEPQPGHIFALPGKMTAAPYVADQIIKQAAALLASKEITPRPFAGGAARALASSEVSSPANHGWKQTLSRRLLHNLV